MQASSPSGWAESSLYLSDERYEEPDPFSELSSATLSEFLQDPQDYIPPEHDSDVAVSVSSIFCPGARPTRAHSDIIFSQDSMTFYVDRDTLLGASFNCFNSRPTADQYPQFPDYYEDETQSIVILPESAEVLNIVLHAIYKMPCSHFPSSRECITQTVDALKKYGVPGQTYIAPGTPLYSLILARTPLFPIEMYSMAAENNLLELATDISSSLLGYDLSSLTDELAVQMGSIYLKRLFFLHLGRVDALKQLLLSAPALHGPTRDCDFAQQRKLTRAWSLAAASLAWGARPDLSTSIIRFTLGSLEGLLTCELCRQSMKSRLQQLIVEWSNIRRTI